ncbi:hypothetical protein H2200_011327 [Cladophialophora chaetospira]|uniref:Ubiquitin-like domain-containing protein n=1 Tax=Cladophialophora chaetospira TaxID=386627 RepID=A0AA39CDP5_9EURO|nr:hypothetical protein H2200_011327 [Cladophialophora chaetospira]
MVSYYYDTRLRDNEVQIRRQTGTEELKVSFRRTVRVSDNSASSELPPDMGKFPLYKVQEYSSTLPADTVAKGGIFMPMYQREAMWVNFEANSPFAVKIYVGSVNAVPGEPVLETSTTKDRRQVSRSQGKNVQDYLVVPGQPWLDGIASSDGAVKQFATGEEAYGGLQFEITPGIVVSTANRSIIVKTLTGKNIHMEVTGKTTGLAMKREIYKREGLPVEHQRLIIKGWVFENDETLPPGVEIAHLVLTLRGGGNAEEAAKVQASKNKMGIAAGGKIKQTVKRDIWPEESWHKEATIAFNVHILNASVFKAVTGLAPPETPITMKVYEALGLPFFKLYEERNTDIHGFFDKVKSIGEIDGVEERDYAIPTKLIDPHSARKENEMVNKSRHPEAISNPAGPFAEFRSVSEIEQELRGVRINATE